MRRHSYLRSGPFNPQGGSGGGTVIITPGDDGVWSCDSDLPVRSLVYISASGTVAKADASSEDTMMAIGFVASKDGSSCGVRTHGELGGFEDLIPGRTYYAGKTPGAIWTMTEGDETFPLVVQVIGRAKTESVLLVTVNPGPFIIFPT